MADQREIALNHLKLYGPSLPVQISKALNTNILFAAAVLSELTSAKKALYSHAAIGGSKVYYLPGQEAALGEKLYPSLKGKEKEAYELLQTSKVLRDVELLPWQRVALRDLKDFAVPLTVSLGTTAELFWRFHLLSDEDAKPYIEGYIVHEGAVPSKEIIKEIVKEPVKEELRQTEPPTPSLKETQLYEEQETTLQELKQQLQSLAEEKQELAEMKKNLREELLKEMKPQDVKPPFEENTKQVVFVGAPEEKQKKPEGKFYMKIKEYLGEHHIEILKEEMIKKDKEFDLIVRIPTPLGLLTYYLKARDKKAINEADISLAHSEGQMKKLPCVFLATGKMNKKAAQLVEQKLQGQVLFKEL